MGSKPSKTKKVEAQRGPGPAKAETSHPPPRANAGIADDEFKPFYDRARAAMHELQKIENFDQGAVGYLNELIKIYYEICSRNMDVVNKIGDILINGKIFKIFVKLWDVCHVNPDEFYSDVEAIQFVNLNRFKVLLWNFTDKCKKLASECYNKDGVTIERIMREFSMSQLAPSTLVQPRLRFMMKANLGILHNVVRHVHQNRNHIRKDDGIEKILAYEKSKYLIIKAKVFIVLAYCINEDENSKIMASSGVITFILTILESAVSSENHVAKSYAFSAEETVQALNKLASNDENKKEIVDAGVLPILVRLLDTETSSASEHLECINCIWSLAFHPDNKDKIIEEPGLIDGVRNLREIDDITDRLKKAIESLMFVLDLEQPIESHHKGGQKHIMLSYNWEVQTVMLKLRDYLSSEGINIWMDVDEIHDSILSAMADAVENSALIVVAMTESYKNSLSCRTEAEYAYQREVPILPLLIQPGYKADGWLGAMVGTKLYVNLSSAEYEQKFPEVLKEVHKRASAPAIVTAQAPPPVFEPPVRAVSSKPVLSNQSSVTSVDGGGISLVRARLACESWSTSDVQSWCSKVGIKGLDDCNGAVLSQLCKMLLRSPDTYYRILREELHMDFKNVLTFTKSVEALME